MNEEAKNKPVASANGVYRAVSIAPAIS